MHSVRVLAWLMSCSMYSTVQPTWMAARLIPVHPDPSIAKPSPGLQALLAQHVRHWQEVRRCHQRRIEKRLHRHHERLRHVLAAAHVVAARQVCSHPSCWPDAIGLARLCSKALDLSLLLAWATSTPGSTIQHHMCMQQ